ncbi:MAG: hypothetical protein JWO15_428 [Sphingomonadales bacterium]|nr:hypothetical protein [Sphingomonadales bacterium]
MIDRDALQAGRAVSGGSGVNLTPEKLFRLLEGCGLYPASDVREARRKFDALQIGVAVGTLENAAPGAKRLAALLGLARAVRPHFADRQPGWFKFLLKLGSQRDENEFQLSYSRRAQSDSARPRAVRDRSRRTQQAVSDNAVAGAILSRIEAASAKNIVLTIQRAIESAINDGDIKIQEAMARTAFQRFRRTCGELEGADTYELRQYDGPLKKFRGRWLAIPRLGSGLPHLPPATGGRPKT